MQTTMVHIHLKPDCIRAFIEACRANRDASIEEPRNRRFDVRQSAVDSARFVLYDAYTSTGDAVAHKQTAHYQTWRETVADIMAKPRQGIPYNGLYPAT